MRTSHDDARAFYRSPIWPDDRLVQLREAFKRDRDADPRHENVEFCETRIQIITEELKRRGVE